jgi:hypothetical protein
VLTNNDNNKEIDSRHVTAGQDILLKTTWDWECRQVMLENQRQIGQEALLGAGVVVPKRRAVEWCRGYRGASTGHLLTVPTQSSFPTLVFFLCGKEKMREGWGGWGGELTG